MIEGNRTHRRLTNETVELTGFSSFYGDQFERCHLKHDPCEHRPLFMLCVLIDCTFDPPLVVEDLNSWRFLRIYGNVVHFTANQEKGS